MNVLSRSATCVSMNLSPQVVWFALCPRSYGLGRLVDCSLLVGTQSVTSGGLEVAMASVAGLLVRGGRRQDGFG